MTSEQKSELRSLIQQYREAAEELGGIQNSRYWNNAYFKVEALQTQIREFIDSI